MTKKTKDKLVCCDCDQECTKCDSCGIELQDGDEIYCNQSEHYCSADCCANSVANCTNVELEEA